MGVVAVGANLRPSVIAGTPDKIRRNLDYKLRSRYQALQPQGEPTSTRRSAIILGSSSLAAIASLSNILLPLPLVAVEKAKADDDEDKGLLGAVTTLFDPNEKTKSGKVLPKAYLKSAREVVKTLRESLKEDPKDITKFRRSADSAKESIRDYLSNWRGQSQVTSEESYVMLEKVIRLLASFYSKAGPSAPLPEGIKSEILGDLSKADEFL